MNKSAKPAKKTRAQLERQVLELQGQLASRYHFASANLAKAGTDKMMSSGVLLQLTALGGREIVDPVVILDGLSDETIAAIQGDLKRSYDLAVMHAVTASKGK